MPKRIEFENISDFQATAMIHEENETFYRTVAEKTVKPVISRLKGVYERYEKRYPWNHIIAVGLKLYSLAKEGVDIDLDDARTFNKKFGLPDQVLRDIVKAVQAEAGAGGAGRARRG